MNKEPITPLSLVAAAIIVGAVALITIAQARPRARPAATAPARMESERSATRGVTKQKIRESRE